MASPEALAIVDRADGDLAVGHKVVAGRRPINEMAPSPPVSPARVVDRVSFGLDKDRTLVYTKIKVDSFEKTPDGRGAIRQKGQGSDREASGFSGSETGLVRPGSEPAAA